MKRTNINQRIKSGFKGIWSWGVVLLLLTACSNDDYLGGHYVTDGEGVEMTLTAKINAMADPDLAWTEGSIIGVAASNGVYDASSRNREYICLADGSTFVNALGYPIYVKGNVSIAAYYPFTGSDGAEQTITLNTLDQSNITDYLFARADDVNIRNGKNVDLVFNYALARFTFNIIAPEGEKITGFKITGLAQNATADPYTLELTLDVPQDLQITGTDISSLTLKLIPQVISDNPEIPAQLVLIGSKRSYTISLNGLSISEGEVKQVNVDVSNGIGSIEFVPNSASWEDSGAGGSYSSN